MACKLCLVSTAVANQGATFSIITYNNSITDTKLFFPVVTFSTQGNTNLLQHLSQVLKEHLTGIYISEKYQQKVFRLLS